MRRGASSRGSFPWNARPFTAPGSCMKTYTGHIYLAARANKDEVDASSGASDRAPGTSKDIPDVMQRATPTVPRRHMSGCTVLVFLR